MIENIIFDLDGTLLDTIHDLTRAMNETLLSFSMNPISVSEATSFIGNGSDALIRRSIKGNELSALDYERFKQAFFTRQLHYQMLNTLPFVGVVDLVNELVKRKHNLFLFSNKPHAFACKLIESRFPHQFTGILGQKDGRPPKPFVGDFIAFMNEHHIDATRSLFVGDSLVDIETARAVNIPSVAVTWGYVDRTILQKAHPEYLIDHPQDLLAIVGAQND